MVSLRKGGNCKKLRKTVRSGLNKERAVWEGARVNVWGPELSVHRLYRLDIGHWRVETRSSEKTELTPASETKV
jgi:prophage tail gpP-like protein